MFVSLHLCAVSGELHAREANLLRSLVRLFYSEALLEVLPSASLSLSLTPQEILCFLLCAVRSTANVAGYTHP